MAIIISAGSETVSGPFLFIMAKFRAADKRDLLICKCGGEIKMRTIAPNSKISHFAECQKCGATAKKPKFLMK